MTTDYSLSASYVSYYQTYSPRWRVDALARASLRITQPPTVEPITLDEAAAHLNIDAYGSPAEYPNADLISALIVAAREYIEGLSGCMLAPQTVELGFRSFGMTDACLDGISLRTGPVGGIASVSYYDENNALQTLAPETYELDAFVSPPRLYLANGQSWPATYDKPNAVRVAFYAGYDARGGSPDTNQIPESLRSAILLMIGHLYENREPVLVGTIASELPMGVHALIQRYKMVDDLA